MKFQGKVALVTGGGRGIGRAIALALTREGASLAIAARTSEETQETRRQVLALGQKALAIPADVSHKGEVERMVATTLKEFGTIDILVNNAGTQGPIGPVADIDIDRWIEAVRVNLIGTFLCCRAVLPTMMAQRQGKIINLSGGGATYPRAYFTAYSASKAAVVRFTECLALEVKDFNIQVNAIAPGAVKTRLWEEIRAAGQRAGEEALAEAHRLEETGWVPPETPASLAVFLASSDSDGLTGRLISAIYDDWVNFPGHIGDIMASEYYTMRRVNPPKQDG